MHPAAAMSAIRSEAAPESPAEACRAQLERKRSVLADLEKHPFRAPWWLRNAHAQTLWGPLVRRSPRVPFRRERWDTPDDDFLDLHFVDGTRGAPALLVLHGLGGSIRSKYVRGLCLRAASMGWTAVALHFRGCGDEINHAPRMYHSGETTDLDFVARRLAERFERLYVAGVSLGGNALAKWLGECGDGVPEQVRAAAVVSAPYDLTVSGPQIDRVLGGLYVRHFLRGLIPKAIEKERQYPGCMPIERVIRSRTFEEFDTFATAALHGFRDAGHYWQTQGCGQFLSGIRRPTLLLSSEDDPFNPGSTLPRLPASQSPYLHPLFTRHGGHAGFVYGTTPMQARYWAEEQVARFFACYNRFEK